MPRLAAGGHAYGHGGTRERPTLLSRRSAARARWRTPLLSEALGEHTWYLVRPARGALPADGPACNSVKSILAKSNPRVQWRSGTDDAKEWPAMYVCNPVCNPIPCGLNCSTPPVLLAARPAFSLPTRREIRRSARSASPSRRDAMHCGRCVATMLLLVSHTEALLTGIATPRRHGAVSVQANLLTKVRAGPDAAQSTRPRVQPWPFQRGCCKYPCPSSSDTHPGPNPNLTPACSPRRTFSSLISC